MPEMLITRGVPGSGKSTFAEQWVAERKNERVEANRDKIRAMLGFPLMGDKDQEDMVTRVHQAVIEGALAKEKGIIVSDTNLRARGVKELIRKGQAKGYSVVVKDFDVPLAELIRRDAGREKSVGEDVVKMLHGRFQTRQGIGALFTDAQKPSGSMFSPLDQDPTLPKAVVFDMDGTLANLGERSPYDYTAVANDNLNENIAELARGYAARGLKIIVFSGRDDSCYDDTLLWLEYHNVPVDELHMRVTGDQRKDSIIKRELIEEHLSGRFFIESWVDDRQQVVKMVRETFGHQNPTICLQVDHGDF